MRRVKTISKELMALSEEVKQLESKLNDNTREKELEDLLLQRNDLISKFINMDVERFKYAENPIKAQTNWLVVNFGMDEKDIEYFRNRPISGEDANNTPAKKEKPKKVKQYGKPSEVAKKYNIDEDIIWAELYNGSTMEDVIKKYKRTRKPSSKAHKRGDVMPDGKIFVTQKIQVTPDKFEESDNKSKELRQLRQTLNVSRRDLASLLDLKVSTVMNCESYPYLNCSRESVASYEEKLKQLI